MSEHSKTPNPRNDRLSLTGGLMLVAAGATLAIIIGLEDAGQFDIVKRWPTVAALAGLVAVFLLHLRHEQRRLATLDARLREIAVREASAHARFTELSFLFDIGTQLQLRLDLPSMLDLAVQRLLPCLEAHQSSIMLFDQETGLLKVHATAGGDTALVRSGTVKPGEGIAGHVFASGETIVVTPEVIRSRFPNDAKPGRRIASGLCVPMRTRGNIIGVVSVSRASGEQFSEMHARMLETFGEHCAATVLKTHHHHELLKHVRKAA